MGRLRSRSVALALVASHLLLLPACGRLAVATTWPLLPKLVRYRRDNVVAYGYKDSSFERPDFSRIEIGNPRAPFSGHPSLCLRLADGTILRTDRLDVPFLRTRSDRSWRIAAPSMRVDEGWRPGLEEIHVGGFRFLVDGERVVWLGVASLWDFKTSEPPPEIADADGAPFYRLPLSQKQLIELFGEPDELYTDLADPL